MREETNPVWPVDASPRLSVVMLGHRRADLLGRAVETFAAHAPARGWEMVLVLNGASPEVRAYSEELLARAAFPLLVLDAGEWRPGEGRNFGVRRARAPVLLFLDDDIECFQDIATATLEIFRDSQVKAAGGANLTPPESGALERATGHALGSWFGAASMRARYRVGAEGEASEHSLILCNLAVRREALLAQRGFAAHLISNEENVLLQQLERGGARLMQSPRLAVYHRRRARWSELWRQAAKYGAGRAQNLLLLPQTTRPIYFLPSLFCAYLAVLPFANAFAWAPLGVYACCALASALAVSLRTRDFAAASLLPLVFPWVHVAYGLSFARTLGRWGLKRKKLLEHAA